jgi:alpha-tubulin suppressor-like RCC1 family protein
VVCALLASCARIVGIQDYHSGDAGSSSMPIDSPPGESSGPDAGSCSIGPAMGGCGSALAAGVGESCAIVAGALYCWGQGLLGNVSSSKPMPQSISTTAVALSTTVDQSGIDIGTTCVSSNFGTECWGNNSLAQTGVVGSAYEPSLEVAADATLNQLLAVGGDHGCAVGGGRFACWGATNDDQLDDGTTVGSGCGGDCSTQATYVDVADIVAIAAGRSHTCIALGHDGVDCWGADEAGQIGNDTTAPYYGLTGADLANAIAISAGASFTCALESGGAAYCWGANAFNQLGTGSGGATITDPTPVADDHRFTAIASGTATTCAIDDAKVVWCWGSNKYGAAGQLNLAAVAATPMQVGVADAILIAVGDNHACAEQQSGAIYCWGDNEFGQLGDNVTNHGYNCGESHDCSPMPVPVDWH